MAHNYTAKDLAEALRKSGVKRGDVIFTHSNAAMFGIPEGGATEENIFNTVLTAFREVLGPEGTLAVPAFTYSFGRRQIFDPLTADTKMGFFAERLRKLPEAKRSIDPMFSVAAIGGKAQALTENVADECFGPDSFWDRFFAANGKVCNLNVFGSFSTYIHYVERKLNIKYRYDKYMPGTVRVAGREMPKEIVFFCQDGTNVTTQVHIDEFNRIALERGFAHLEKVGRGSIQTISAADTFKLIQETLPEMPYFLTASFKSGVAPVLLKASPVKKPILGKGATARDFLSAFQAKRLDPLSESYDEAVDTLADQLSGSVTEIHTGSRCGPWVIPEAWKCLEAKLETTAGKLILSDSADPFCVAGFSQSFDGVVSREELLGRFYSSPDIALHRRRDWGFCGDQALKSSLVEKSYVAKVRPEFRFGSLHFASASIRGSGAFHILVVCDLSQHHPVAAAAGLEIFRRLSERKTLRHSYHFKFGHAGFATASGLLPSAEKKTNYSAGFAIARQPQPFAFRIQDLKLEIPFLTISPSETDETCSRVLELVEEWEKNANATDSKFAR